MSARSIRRSHQRSIHRRAKTATAVAVAIGAGAALAPSAQAGNFVVTSLADGPSNACDANCTLRDAVDAGTIDSGADTITFASGLSGTIEMDPAAGDFEIYDETNLQGPGSDVVTVDGNGLTNVFYVATEPANARIAGLTIKGGRSSKGAGIYIFDAMGPPTSTVAVDDVTFTGNTATDGGGAINSSQGNVTVTDSRFIDNNAADSGGAITGSPPNLTIRRSTFTSNSAGDDGGAIRVAGSVQNLLVEDSTFNGNTGNNGGALLLFGPSESGTIRNTTITGNTSATGGGIENTNARDVTTQLLNSTLTGNSASTSGGGIRRQASDDPGSPGLDDMVISSSIVAGNTSPGGADISQPAVAGGELRVGSSLIGQTVGEPIASTAPNLLGADPQLGPLQNNGGPTQTMLPAASSPVVDAGTANGLPTDQRGQPRTVGGGTDIGAVERGIVDGASVNARKKQKQKGKKVQIKVSVSASETATAVVGGTVSIKKKKLQLKSVTTGLAAGQAVALKLKPASKSGAKKITRALQSGKKVKGQIDVTLSDPFGATFSSKTAVKLK